MSKLYRTKGMFFGVCAGIAEYFGFDVNIVRIVFAIAAFVFFPLLFFAYFLLAFLLPRKPFNESDVPAVDPQTHTRVRANPHNMLGSVRHRFRELESRLQRLEKYVTSNRFKLDREFRELKSD